MISTTNLLGSSKLNFQFDENTGKVYSANNALYSSSYNEFNIIFKNIADEYDKSYNNYKKINYKKNIDEDIYYGDEQL